MRLQVITADANGTASSTIDLGAKGGASAGEQKHYQYWYRDPGQSPCGSGFNLTNGLSITWTL